MLGSGEEWSVLKYDWQRLGTTTAAVLLALCIVVQSGVFGITSVRGTEQRVAPEDVNRIGVQIDSVSSEDNRANITLNVTSPNSERYGLQVGHAVVEVLETENLCQRDVGSDDWFVNDTSEPATMRVRAKVVLNETNGYQWALFGTGRLVGRCTSQIPARSSIVEMDPGQQRPGSTPTTADRSEPFEERGHRPCNRT